MKIEDFKTNYYSGFEGEPEIRFYINSKTINFPLEKQPDSGGYHSGKQLEQGAYGVYFFNLWEGYFDTIARAVFDYFSQKPSINELPKFLNHWHQTTGWYWDFIPELISETEIIWLLNELSSILQKKEMYSKKLEQAVINYDCIKDLIIFLNYAIKENMEIRISLE